MVSLSLGRHGITIYLHNSGKRFSLRMYLSSISPHPKRIRNQEDLHNEDLLGLFFNLDRVSLRDGGRENQTDHIEEDSAMEVTETAPAMCRKYEQC